MAPALASLSCPASDGLTYTSGSNVFNIYCGRDYYGGDLGLVQVSTFAQCLDTCTTTKNCIDVAYVGQNCYMKDKITEPRLDGNVWGAVLASADPSKTNEITCVNGKSNGQTYVSSSGAQFLIECGKDYYGGDLNLAQTSTFAKCVETCATTKGCVDVAYVGENCYMKSTVTEARNDANVWSAKAIASTTNSNSDRVTCDSNKSDGSIYTAPSGAQFTIECGTDYYGGDFDSMPASTMEDCLNACDKADKCLTVAYSTGAKFCYLKSVVNSARTDSNVWGATKKVVSNPTVTTTDLSSSTSVADPAETTFELDEPFDLGSVAPAILAPVSPPDIDMGSLDRFDTVPTSNLWFNGANAGGDEEDGAVTVRVAVDYMYPSIVLDQSIYIKDVVCNGNSISGKVNLAEGYRKSKTAWVNHPLIFVTSSSSCVTNGSATFQFISSSAQFDDSTMSFTINGQAAELADIFDNMAVDFGKIEYDVPDNSSSNSTSKQCGSPSASTLHGLPAVNCGATFDQTLNDRLGYYSSDSNQAQVVQLADASQTGVQRRGSYSTDLIIRSDLEKRGFFSVFKKIAVAVVKQVAQVVKQTVVAAVQKTAQIAVAVVRQVAKVVVFIATGKYDQSLTLPLDMTPPANALTDSPWGKAVKFYEWSPDKSSQKYKTGQSRLQKIAKSLIAEPDPQPGVKIYCVNCGIQGKIVAVGSIQVNRNGLQDAAIGCHGNLYAGLFLGVNAFATYEKKYEKELFKRGLPGWSIPKVVTLGPSLSLGVESVITIEAEGQLFTGASLTWPAFEASINFVDSSRSRQSGFVPQIDRKFQAAGSVSAEASIGLPVSLEFGIDILAGKFKRSVALTDTPAVAASAKLAASYDFDSGAVLGNEECKGIAWDIKLKNEVSLGIKKEGEKEDGPEFKLAEWESGPLADGCITLAIGVSTTKSPAISTTISTTLVATTSSSIVPTTATTSSLSTTSISSSTTTSPSTITSTTPSATPTPNTKSCSYWANSKYTDSRSNSWNFECNAASTKLMSDDVYVATSYTKSDLLACVETCNLDIQLCQIVYWQEASKTCYVVNSMTNNDGYRRIYNNVDQRKPTDIAASFDAVARPISPFTIDGIVFDDWDVTSDVWSYWNRGHWLEIYPKPLRAKYGNSGFFQTYLSSLNSMQRELHMFYRDNGQKRVFDALENEFYVIRPGAIQWPGHQRNVPDPIPAQNLRATEAGKYVRVWDVAWGVGNVPVDLVPAIQDLVYWTIWNNNQWQIDSRAFRGYDGRFGLAKVGVFWIEAMDNPGYIYQLHCYEGAYLTAKQFKRPWKRDVFEIEARQSGPTDTSTPAGGSTSSGSTSSGTTNSGTTNSGTTSSGSTSSGSTSSGSDTSSSGSGSTSSGSSSSGSVSTSSGTDTTSSGSGTISTTNNTTAAGNDTTPAVFKRVTTISDASSQIFLNLGKDGNLWLSSTSTSADDVSKYSSGNSFIGTDSDDGSMVVGDSASQYLHYFPEEMSATGVSRFRVATWDKLPRGSKLVNLLQVTDQGSSMLVGVDGAGSISYLWFCSIDGQLNKVFLARSVSEFSGVGDDLTYTVTGGTASDCQQVAMAATFGDVIS